MDRNVDGQMDGWTTRWTDGWSGRWTNRWKWKQYNQVKHVPLSPSRVLVCINTTVQRSNWSIMSIRCLSLSIWNICHIYHIKAYFPLFTCLLLKLLIMFLPSAQHSWCFVFANEAWDSSELASYGLHWVSGVLLCGALISCRVNN